MKFNISFCYSVYYSLENIAFNYTLAFNVGLFVTSAPILTDILSSVFIKNSRLNKNLIFGFILAMDGSFLVIFNRNFILKLSPFGDILAILAAMVWAAYSVILTRINDKYNYVYITRRIFFMESYV